MSGMVSNTFVLGSQRSVLSVKVLIILLNKKPVFSLLNQLELENLSYSTILLTY